MFWSATSAPDLARIASATRSPIADSGPLRLSARALRATGSAPMVPTAAFQPVTRATQTLSGVTSSAQVGCR